MKPEEEPQVLRFRRDEDDSSLQPQTTFFPHLESTTKRTMSPNERVLKQVRESMDRLGIKDVPPPTPPPPRFVDISNANPASTFLGASVAALLSFAAWNMLNNAVHFAVTHPMDDQIYIVQRVTVVIRTALVSLFALASGFSGVTSLGLFLLTLRLSWATITGEFATEKDSSKPLETGK